MKGIIYQLQVSASVFESMHGQSYTIREIYFPEIGMFFNTQSCGKYHKGRYDGKGVKVLGEFEVQDSDVWALKQVIAHRTEAEVLENELLKRYTNNLTIPTIWKCNGCGDIVKDITPEMAKKNEKEGKSMNDCMKCKSFYSPTDDLSWNTNTI